MIGLTKLRDLDLAAAATSGRHLSAASGLVCVQTNIYVIADDELHLGVFCNEQSEPGRLIRLFGGVLPRAVHARKKRKPDLEALMLLPPHGDFPHGALLALGSGSRVNRRMGALLRLDRQGAARGSPLVVDLSPMLVPLHDAFAEPNIEGATISGNELRLFQRGNRRNPDNAVIRYPLSALLDALRAGHTGAIKPSAVVRFDLGQIDGVPFCFTDAAALPDGGMVFTAVAEETDDAYDDGPCRGAAIGRVDNDVGLVWMRPLDRAHKVEGIDARVDGDLIRLLLVTDADDPNIAASLFSATTAR